MYLIKIITEYAYNYREGCRIRSWNTRLIKEAIEKNRGYKVFTKTLGRSHLAKLTTSNGLTVTSVLDILAKIEDFYGNLYASHAQKPPPDATPDPSAPLSRHFTDDLPDVDVDEIGAGLRQLKNGKAPGEVGVASELLKAGGKPVREELKKLFNSVIANGTTPNAWSRGVVALFKKRDKTLLKN
ncbi:hypothetical protein O0L34_g215 [Tuta absoluta]|nr:hypothetical protein O0L34_g215 [Tuta absoluta]